MDYLSVSCVLCFVLCFLVLSLTQSDLIIPYYIHVTKHESVILRLTAILGGRHRVCHSQLEARAQGTRCRSDAPKAAQIKSQASWSAQPGFFHSAVQTQGYLRSLLCKGEPGRARALSCVPVSMPLSVMYAHPCIHVCALLWVLGGTFLAAEDCLC